MLKSIITRGTRTINDGRGHTQKRNIYILLAIPCMYKVNTMDIKDVQNVQGYERRNIRINIRITPSQDKFIIKNNLSITKVMNEALKQLGYVPPKLEEIPEHDIENRDKGKYWKAHSGRGDRIAQRRRWKTKQKINRRRH